MGDMLKGDVVYFTDTAMTSLDWLALLPIKILKGP